MKNSGGRDTFLLFIVLLLALGAVCWLCVIQKNVDKLNDVKDELRTVEQEKARNDAIIQQAQQLDQEKEALKAQLQSLETKLLPELITGSIQRKLFKNFEDAKIPFIVEVSNTPLAYDTVIKTDGKISDNRVKSSRYTFKVSGTDGFLLTHDEVGDGKVPVDIPYTVFYSQYQMRNADPNAANPEAQKYGYNSANDIKTKTYVGYDEFVAALKKIETDAPDYVKIAEIGIEDTKQGYCTYTAAVDVYAYELIDRISPAPTNMLYQSWVGAENIATGGLVGLPSYFVVINPEFYKVPEDSPLYGRFISFNQFQFQLNRPFAAWSHWGYEWNYIEETFKEAESLPPYLAQLLIRYKIGAITPEEYNALVNEFNAQMGGNSLPAVPDDDQANS